MVVQNGEMVALGERKARAWREMKRGCERCGELWAWCSPFIGAGGAPGRGGPELIVMALTPLKALRPVNAQFEGD
jgi:hypothetical protein